MSVLLFRSKWRELYQLAYRLRSWRVQAAFGLAKARPAAGARVLTGLHGASAMGAADAGVVLIMQWIVGHVVLDHIAPNHLSRPVGERTDLDQIEFVVPIYFAYTLAFQRLIAADAG